MCTPLEAAEEPQQYVGNFRSPTTMHVLGKTNCKQHAHRTVSWKSSCQCNSGRHVNMQARLSACQACPQARLAWGMVQFTISWPCSSILLSAQIA